MVQDARAGPYQLQVGILPGSPKVGNLHLSITVQDAENETIITDAIVLVAAKGPVGAADVAPVQAVSSPLSPQSYEVDIPLDTAGSWTVTLETDGRWETPALTCPSRSPSRMGSPLPGWPPASSPWWRWSFGLGVGSGAGVYERLLAVI